MNSLFSPVFQLVSAKSLGRWQTFGGGSLDRVKFRVVKNREDPEGVVVQYTGFYEAQTAKGLVSIPIQGRVPLPFRPENLSEAADLANPSIEVDVEEYLADHDIDLEGDPDFDFDMDEEDDVGDQLRMPESKAIRRWIRQLTRWARERETEE